MKVEIQKVENLQENLYLAFVTVKSGNKYAYSCLLYEELTETQIKQIWDETRRKHWYKVSC